MTDCHDEAVPRRATGARPQIVLAGNPNVGKTTLFNALTGLSAKVSNYPGITVERRTGSIIYKEKIDKVAACWGSPLGFQ